MAVAGADGGTAGEAGMQCIREEWKKWWRTRDTLLALSCGELGRTGGKDLQYAEPDRGTRD